MAWKINKAKLETLTINSGKNYTQLAAAAGIALGTMYAVANGKRSPSINTLSKLAAVLGVSVEQFAERIDEE